MGVVSCCVEFLREKKMKTDIEVTVWHEMRITFPHSDLAFSCYRHLRDKYPELNASMGLHECMPCVTLGMECSVEEWIEVLESFN